MADSSLTLHPADEDSLDYVTELLSANDLPTADVEATDATFYLASVDGERVGIGGIERDGEVGLLRSVVVETAARGRGLGTTLTEALEARAAADGIETLYLLTTTAADFFAGRGYERVAREAVPEPINETTEFSELCPSSATCLRKSLS